MSDAASRPPDQPTVVLGVVGADVHIVGAKILDFALTEAGFHVVNLGIMVSQEEFIEAAIETDAEAVLVSSVYGHGEIDCRGFRDKCVELGADDLLLLVGGNLVVGRRSWPETEAVFRGYGFDRVYPPGTDPDTAIRDLRALIAERRARIGSG
jgi:methylaspartate mutase sigma subunit